MSGANCFNTASRILSIPTAFSYVGVGSGIRGGGNSGSQPWGGATFDSAGGDQKNFSGWG